MSATVEAQKPLGFWSCWALSVGCMIGSGVFTLPAVLAPYGLLSFGGWLLSAAGAIALALVFAQLAASTARSGGPYVYAQEAFGELAGFVIAWGYWCSYVIAIPAVAIAFAGYLPVFAPALEDNKTGEAIAALALIVVLTAVNLRGLKEAGAVQIVMTILKIAPLLAVAALGLATGDPSNLPPADPKGAPVVQSLAATALLTLWAFTGFEAGAMPAGSVRDAKRVIPRAIVVGMLTVTAVYFVSTTAVMLLVPAGTLVASTSPFAEAARGFGPVGAWLVAGGALVATAGTLNGLIFVAGQMPTAAAADGLAPSALARVNQGGAPVTAILFSSVIGGLLLLTNYSRGTIGAFTFLVTMSTLAILLPYLVSALAVIRREGVRPGSIVALIGAAYAMFAIVGSGAEVALWGGVLLAAGLPLYALQRLMKTRSR